MEYPYFKGLEADRYSFYRVPKALVKADLFQKMSGDAKLLYAVLLDRMSLSIKNGWQDKHGNAYIICTIEEVMDSIHCARQKAVKLLNELEQEFRLIERRRQGLGKPNLLYVKDLYPGQCDGQSGYGVTTLDAVVESIVCMKFEEILECSKSNLLEEMRRKDLDAAKKETTRWKEEVQTKVDEQDALKKEMIRVIQGTSGLDREMIQQMVNENKEALLTAQTNLADSEKKLKEIEEQNQKAERNCSDLFTWASTYKGASFERRQAILKQFIKEVRVGRDYNIEIVLNVPLDEFEEFKRHAASTGWGKNQKNKSQNPQKVGRCTSNAGIVVLDKTAGETISIVPKNAAHAILRC